MMDLTSAKEKIRRVTRIKEARSGLNTIANKVRRNKSTASSEWTYPSSTEKDSHRYTGVLGVLRLKEARSGLNTIVNKVRRKKSTASDEWSYASSTVTYSTPGEPTEPGSEETDTSLSLKERLASIPDYLPTQFRLILKSGRSLTLSISFIGRAPGAVGRRIRSPKQTLNTPTKHLREISTTLKNKASSPGETLAPIGRFAKRVFSPTTIAAATAAAGRMIMPVRMERIPGQRPTVALTRPGLIEGAPDRIDSMKYRLESIRGRRSELSSSISGAMPAEFQIVLNSGRVLILNKAKLSAAKFRMMVWMGTAFPSLYGVKTQEVIDFSRNLATLLESGVPLLFALQILHRQTSRPKFRDVLAEIMEDLEQGATFSEACGRHPTVFHAFYVRLIQVGEETGTMETSLRALVKQMKKDEALKAKLKGGMTYPMFVLALGFGIVLMLALFVLPTMAKIYTQNGMDVPFMLSLMISAGDFVKAYASFLMMGLIALGLALMMFTSRVPAGQKMKDLAMIKAPVLGKVRIYGSMSRLCNNMAILLRAGVSLTDGLRLMIQSSESIVLREALTEIDNRVHAGDSLSEAMKHNHLFPLMMTQMVEVGEMTGRLETNMELVGDFYEDEADRSTAKLVSLLGPGMMVIIGGIVGGVAVTMFSGIYGMYGNLG